MTRHCLLPLTVFALLGSCGCQSGRVSDVQVSADGMVLAFRDSRYNRLYVADSKRVRDVGFFGKYILSPDGRWLAIIGTAQPRADEFIVGARLLLIDLEKNKRYETRFPSCGVIFEPATQSSATQPSFIGKNPPPGPRIVSLFFGPGPRLLIGPTGRGYWSWEPQHAGQTAWTQLSGESAAAAVAACTSRVPLFGQRPDDSPRSTGYIGVIPSDGSIALRTVWVRPDGSTIELLRKNDAPAPIVAIVVVYPFGLTYALAWDLVVGPIERRSPGVYTGMYMLGMSGAWHSVVEDLEVDKDKLRRAQEILQEQIDQRRAAASSQPTTAPDR